MDGLLLVDKPEGPTSHDVIDRARHILGIKRVGHAGTLDPMATGLLLVLVGKATRLAEYVSSIDKSYEGTIKLGVGTDTGDRLGSVVAEKPCPADLGDLAIVASRLTGEQDQKPPMYSAVSVGGKRLHEIARSGGRVDRPSRPINIHELRLWAAQPGDPSLVGFQVRCSKGTYIRVLAEDIGAAMGCPAHLTSLRRITSGPWTIESAATLAQLADMGGDAIAGHLVGLASMLPDLPSATLSPEQIEAIGHGQRVSVGPPGPEPLTEGRKLKLVDAHGELVAVAKAIPGSGGEWLAKPEKVFV